MNAMEKAVPIETDLGFLYGRDCIYLDMVRHDSTNNLVFEGEINGALASRQTEKEWVAYRMSFRRVLACFFCELETYENTTEENHFASSFDSMEESTWLHSLPIRKDFESSQYKHYRLVTYDVVYNIIAVSHQIEFDM